MEAIHKLLEISAAWQIVGIRFNEANTRVEFSVQEQPAFWITETCPSCKSNDVICHDHVAPRTWRHLNTFKKESIITCAVPRGKCKECEKIFQVVPPWLGKSKHFTSDFETFLLLLMKDLPVKKVAKIVSETDQKLWRMLFAHVEAAQSQLSEEAVKIVRQQWEEKKNRGL